ncbi:MAG TPA: EAL domain-containing protein, partial [Solirubrobacteraceae bacterium]|nr:EAL domain-containing protein [Solirubrobacteraceae bacterium]
GLVKAVPAAELPAFERQIAAHPLHPFGAGTRSPETSFQVLPPGPRPYYCFAVAGLARSRATYVPTGVDYCALAPALVGTRDTGEPSYAPFKSGTETTLGVETPVYATGVVPRTVAARRHAFIGWLGELLRPNLVLQRALQGHHSLGVRFRYGRARLHVVFTSGHVAGNAPHAVIPLHNGWVVESFGAPIAAGPFANLNSLVVLVGGALLSIVLGLLLLTLGTGRRRALSLVREKTRELSHQALHDALTGLPNRALVLDRAEQMLARAARSPGTLTGALFVDVDGFKHVNDSLGHAAGDELLRVVGKRLLDAVRAQDTVGRLGGDEFVVLIESPAGEDAVDLLAERLTEVLREPVELEAGGRMFAVTASVGVAVGHYSSPDQLLRDADLALYAAKAAGKDRYALYESSMSSGSATRLELEADLGSAAESGQLFLLYQPIFALPARTVVGVEALLRWRHPRRGVLAPDAFIPLAEDSGLIVPVGRWVLIEACRQAAAWAAEGLELGISVNVSAQQLGRPGFAEDVLDALNTFGLAAAKLTLEITETTLMSDMAVALGALEAVKALGVHIAIDDFGTGYASLAHLRRTPADILKIDRSFVAAIDADDQGRELLEAIVGVGQALSLAVVAEGVEEASQVATLEALGCNMAQGFLMGRPAPAEAIEILVGETPSKRTPAPA